MLVYTHIGAHANMQTYVSNVCIHTRWCVRSVYTTTQNTTYVYFCVSTHIHKMLVYTLLLILGPMCCARFKICVYKNTQCVNKRSLFCVQDNFHIYTAIQLIGFLKCVEKFLLKICTEKISMKNFCYKISVSTYFDFYINFWMSP